MNKLCKVCKKEFNKITKESITQWGERKYCSKPCYRIGSRNRVEKKCAICKKLFFRTKSQEFWRGESKYCSRKCFFNFNREKKHYKWNKNPSYGCVHQWLHKHFRKAS